MIIKEITNDEELESILNEILKKIYDLETTVAKLDTEVGVLTESVFEGVGGSVDN